jgi:hypothetical protein
LTSLIQLWVQLKTMLGGTQDLSEIKNSTIYFNSSVFRTF